MIFINSGNKPWWVRFLSRTLNVQVAEWLKAPDCKSGLARVRWFKSNPVHKNTAYDNNCNQVQRTLTLNKKHFEGRGAFPIIRHKRL